jgi:NAD(P)-dependent dehydrogenase (short-subunit alcohol dehydrogenase family)
MITSLSRVWFITGASSGFGRAIADAALEHGDEVVAAAWHAGRTQVGAVEETTDEELRDRTLIVEPGAFRTGLHGTQPGDPAKAAQAILTALEDR